MFIKLSPRMVRNIKTLFHALTAVMTAIAALGIMPGGSGGLGAMVPERYAIYIALLSSVVSGLLNLMTRAWPWLATETTADDPPCEDPVTTTPTPPVPVPVPTPVPAPNPVPAPTPTPAPAPVPPPVTQPVPDHYYPQQFSSQATAEGSGVKGDLLYQHAALQIFYLFPQFGTAFYAKAIADNHLRFIKRL